MNRTDKLVLLALLLAILLLPGALGALHERPRRAEEPIRVVVEHATPTHWYRTPTPRPPEPTATVFRMPITVVWPTPRPTEAPRWTPYIALSEGMTEQEAIEWLDRGR
jgi:hypothetical protein